MAPCEKVLFGISQIFSCFDSDRSDPNCLFQRYNIAAVYLGGVVASFEEDLYKKYRNECYFNVRRVAIGIARF